MELGGAGGRGRVMGVRAVVVQVGACSFFERSAVGQVPFGGMWSGLGRRRVLQVSNLHPAGQLVGTSVSVGVILVEITGLGSDRQHHSIVLVALLAFVRVGDEIREVVIFPR